MAEPKRAWMNDGDNFRYVLFIPTEPKHDDHHHIAVSLISYNEHNFRMDRVSSRCCPLPFFGYRH